MNKNRLAVLLIVLCLLLSLDQFTSWRSAEQPWTREEMRVIETLRKELELGHKKTLDRLCELYKGEFHFKGNLTRLIQQYVPETEELPEAELCGWMNSNIEQLEFVPQTKRFRKTHKG